MKRSEIRSFLNSGVNAINPRMPFGSGRITEWNSNRSNEYPGIWWESTLPPGTEFPGNITLPQDQWQINLHIGKLDKHDSSAVEYEQIIDDCDYIAQQLIHQYNQIIDQSEKATLTGISRPPFVKKHADCISGVILSFILNTPDGTNLC
jgi:hypothetical protein